MPGPNKTNLLLKREAEKVGLDLDSVVLEKDKKNLMKMAEICLEAKRRQLKRAYRKFTMKLQLALSQLL